VQQELKGRDNKKRKGGKSIFKSQQKERKKKGDPGLFQSVPISYNGKGITKKMEQNILSKG
jgi:hypothetical protein